MDVLMLLEEVPGLQTSPLCQREPQRMRCLMSGGNLKAMEQNFIHGTLLELLQYLEMDVVSMVEILMVVIMKVKYLKYDQTFTIANEQTSYLEDVVEEMPGMERVVEVMLEENQL